jgi:tetratricopeptide (TPR) repeat protein
MPRLFPFAPLALASILALVGGSLVFAQATPPTAEELFARGVARHQGGDILGAVEAYLEALALEPGRIDARSNLGAAYVRLGRYGDAVEQYRKALGSDPDQTKVRFNLALALYKSELIEDAGKELEAVLARDGKNKAALLLLADCQLRLGQDANVVALLGPHERELGEDRLFNYLLGTALLQRNELLRGQQHIDRLFRGGETAEGRLLMGVAQIGRQEFKAALPELRRAIELNAKLPTVHSVYGRALMGTGQREEAADAYRKELETNPNDFESNLYLGLLLKDANRLDEAEAHLKRAARLRPRDARVLYGLGSLHLAAGRVEESQKALEAVTAQVPEYTQAHVLLATVYYRQKKKELGDKEKAIADKLRKEKQAQEPGALDDLGPAYRGEGPDAEAPQAEPRKDPITSGGPSK